jgi:hypothetical protein
MAETNGNEITFPKTENKNLSSIRNIDKLLQIFKEREFLETLKIFKINDLLSFAL